MPSSYIVEIDGRLHHHDRQFIRPCNTTDKGTALAEDPPSATTHTADVVQQVNDEDHASQTAATTKPANNSSSLSTDTGEKTAVETPVLRTKTKVIKKPAGYTDSI